MLGHQEGKGFFGRQAEGVRGWGRQGMGAPRGKGAPRDRAPRGEGASGVVSAP